VRKIILILGALAIVAALAIPALASTRSITVGDRFFLRKGSPPTVTVHRGTHVRFVWRGHQRHNVTATNGPVRFHSRTQTHGTYTVTPHRTGRYTIVCTIHPGMEMTLRVIR
jgi:plastocyanin